MTRDDKTLNIHNFCSIRQEIDCAEYRKIGTIPFPVVAISFVPASVLPHFIQPFCDTYRDYLKK